LKDRENAVVRREIELEERERLLSRRVAQLARKRKEVLILKKTVARREGIC
jgi:hypothetical protein